MRPSLRHGLTALHRWAGFTLGLLFVLMGLSGSLLVFEHEVDAALNPALFHGCGHAAQGVDAAVAAASVQARWPGANVSFIALPLHDGGVLRVTFKAAGVADNEAMVDGCGNVLGSRDRLAARVDAVHLMPTLQAWHLNMLQGKEGRMAQGYIGLALAVLLLAGLILAWPKSGQGRQKWRRALHVKLDQHRYRLHYDLHRVAGLLFIPVLLMLALTGFYNGLPEQGRSLVAAFAAVTSDRRAPSLPKLEKGEAAIGWREVQAIAAPYMRDGAQLAAIARQPDRGLYQVRLRRADDWQRTGSYRLFIDMRSAKVVRIFDPRSGKNADVFLAALFPLHSGQLGGMVGKCVMAFAGLLPALFFITGITTWLLRRKKRAA